MLKKITSAIFLIGFVLGLIGGGETRSLFFWPGGFLLGFAGMASVIRWRKSVRFEPAYALQLFFWVGLGYAVWRTQESPVSFLAREDLVLLLALALVYSRMTRVADHPQQRMDVFYCVLGVAGVQLCVAAVQSRIPGWHPIQWMEQPVTGSRISGLFSNPNHLGSYLVVTGFLLLGVLCFGRGGATKRVVYGFVAAILGIGVIMTQSRGALAGGMCGLVCFVFLGAWLVWRMHRDSALKILGLSGVAGVLLVAVASMAVHGENLDRLGTGKSELVSVRGEIWKTAMAQAEVHPWFGAGARAFFAMENRYRSEDFNPILGEAEFAHSEFIQVLADYGRLGLLVAVMVLVGHLVMGIHFLRWFVRVKHGESGASSGNTLGLTVGALSALVGLLVHAAVEFQLHTPAMILLLGLLLGILAAPGFEAGKERGVARRIYAKFMGFPGVVAAAVMLWFVGTKGLADVHLFRGSELQAHPDAAIEVNWETERFRDCFFSMAADFDPDHYVAWTAAGESRVGLYMYGDPVEKEYYLDDAIDAYQAAVKANPWDRVALRALADLEFIRNRQESAERAVQQLVYVAPNDDTTWGTLALLRMRQARFLEAELACLRMRDSSLVTVDIQHFFRFYATLLHMQARSIGLPKSPGFPDPSEF